MYKIFLDTNILVYLFDAANLEKQKKCREILANSSHTFVISTQVLQEFFVVVTKKLGISPILAKEIIKSFDAFEVATVDQEVILQAIDTSQVSQISFWDALSVSSAQRLSCDQLWTEDLQNGQKISGLEIVNPLLTS